MVMILKKSASRMRNCICVFNLCSEADDDDDDDNDDDDDHHDAPLILGTHVVVLRNTGGDRNAWVGFSRVW